MSNKTFIPAFKAAVGDWDYYICIMKYAELARQVGFAHELGGNKDLSTMIQRGLSDRTEPIRQYLLNSKHRFLGGLIVAAWGGEPEYVPIAMDDPEGMLEGLDQGFGVLTFDGTQQFFALDGQHRLKAIKDALKKKPELGREDVCVLLVPHYDSEEGRTRTRRLFTNINRNAKTTTRAENIALDVDDGFAVLTRRFLDDHDFLSREGVVNVFTRVGEEGELKLATGSVAQTHGTALTTISVLYDCLTTLGFGLHASMSAENQEPSPEVLDASYETLKGRVDDLLTHCGDVRKKMESAKSAREVRAPKGREAEGHPFMRPVVQKAVVRVSRQIVDQEALEWSDVMKRLSELEWEMGKVPWLAVYNPDQSRMITGKDFTELLFQLLYVHLAPTSKQQIQRARKTYRALKGSSYPVSEADLATRIQAQPATAGADA